MTRTRALLLPALVAAVAACGGKSCSCLAPIPGGFPTDGRRHENAMQLRVTGGALDYLAKNGKPLIEAALPGGKSTVDVPASCGGKNEVCCQNGMKATCKIDVGFQSMSLTPAPPKTLKVVVTTRLKSLAPIPISFDTGFLGKARCLVGIDTTAGKAGHTDVDLVTDVQLGVDGQTSLTRIDLVNPTLDHLDETMLTISPQPGDFICLAGALKQVRTFVIGELKKQLTAQITTSVDDALCATCKAQGDCDAFADACTGGKCQRMGKCLQEIGAAGRLDVGALLAKLSPGTRATLDTLAVLGGYADVTPAGMPGMSLGLLGGGEGAPHNACVPMRPAPMALPVGKWSGYLGEVEPRGHLAYHLGVGVHRSHLDQMAWAAFDSGALCLAVGTPAVAQLNGKTVSVLIPSLADLTRGQSAPMFLVMRPGEEPHVTLGAGTFDVDPMSMKKTIREPLLHVRAPRFAIDFYAFVDERYLRVMTLTADLDLGISLDVDGEGQLVPLLGDLGHAFTNLVVTNSSLLTEKPASLAAAFPSLLAVAVGQVTGALKPIALPAVSGIKLKVVAIEPTDDLSTLGLFANFDLAPTSSARAETWGEVTRVVVPETAAFSVEGGLDAARAPRVELALGGRLPDGRDAAAGGLEWSWSIDGGPWSPASAAARPTVSDPLLWIQGHHTVDVRARAAGAPETTDPSPVRLEALVDTVAPAGAVDEVGGVLVARATDNVTEAAKLEYRTVDAAGAASEWARGARLDGSARGATRVEARDEAGNVGELAFHGRTAAPTSGGCGCAVAGGAPGGGGAAACVLSLLAALGLAGGRRRARATARRVANEEARRARGAARSGAGGGGLAAALVISTAALLGAAACGDDAAPSLSKGDLLDPGDQIGRFSDAVAAAGRIYVSAYDDTLGDLAYAEVPVSAAGTGAPIAWQWVDGVPDGPIDTPGGYRRGTSAPGDDVGRYSSIALTVGHDPRIAYFDVTHHALRFARAKDRHFVSGAVDSLPGATVGLYASLSIDAHDVPSIAYAVVDLAAPDGKGGFVSRLRLATAKSALPSGPGDWTVVDLDETPMTCAGVGKATLCGAGRACVDATPGDHTTSVCKPVDAMCPKACAATEACVSQACVPALAPSGAPDLVEGTGLFAQLRRRPDGHRVVAYYDREHGQLRVVTESAPGIFGKVIVDGKDGARDVGQFAAAGVGPDGTLHVAYVDAIADRLLYRTVQGGTPSMASEVVDDGLRDGGPHPVGAGASLWTDGSAVRVAYQDQATASLWLATRGGGGGGGWTRRAVSMGSAGHGFFPHLVSDGGRLYVTELVYDRGAMTFGALAIAPLQ